MVYKKILLILALIFSINLVSSALIINPQETSLSTTVGQDTIFNLNLTNTFPFAIQDITFQGLEGFDFGNVVLQPNETKTIAVSVNRNAPFSGRIVSIVKFNYLLPVPQTPQTFYINITDNNGFLPQTLTIHEDDIVIWTNKGTITHSVTSNIFNQELLPNGIFQYTFSQQGEVNYLDSIVFFNGKIIVLNKTTQQPVNNPEYNTNFIVNLTSILNPTDLKLEIIENNFTIKFADLQEGLLKITNTGNREAVGVSLSGNNWISFDENNFNLNSGVVNFVTFKIIPIITLTSETNKTYTIQIKAKAQNSQEFIGNINVFVPFENIDTINDTNIDDFFRSKLVFCRQFPTSGFCITEPIIKEINKTILIEKPSPYNFTQDEIATIFTILRRLQDSDQRNLNECKILKDFVETNFPQMLNQINQSNSISLKTEERIEESSILRWIFGVGAVIIICLVSVFYWLRKYNIKRAYRGMIGG